MTAINQDDTFYAGNKRTLKFTILNKDVTPNVPLNLTGMTLKWALSRLNADGTYGKIPVLTKTPTVTNAAAGECEVPLLKADTQNLGGKYHQELEVYDGASEPVVVAVGTLNLLRNITNP